MSSAAVRCNTLHTRYDCSIACASASTHDPKWNLSELRTLLAEDWRQAVAQISLPPLTEMMIYALSGGKCLRGLLLLAVADSCNGSRDQARQAAVAIEMLHAASLVVDDLPALDDTPMRRGTQSLYKRDGEAAAILTAHALVAAAFEIVSQISSAPERLLRITNLVAATIGARGMAAGELLDPCNSVSRDIDVSSLKTGSLFRLVAQIAAVLAGSEPELAEDLGQLGLRIGICYQLVDDFRDDDLESNKAALYEAGRRSWRECVELFSLLRARLHIATPIETWLSEFHDASVTIIDASLSGPESSENRSAFGSTEGPRDLQL